MNSQQVKVYWNFFCSTWNIRSTLSSTLFFYPQIFHTKKIVLE